MFTFFKEYGFLIIASIVLIRLAVSKVFWRNLSFENNLLSAITSITAPCLLIKEKSHFFWTTNVFSNILSLMIVWITYFIARFDVSPFTQIMVNTTFQCSNLTTSPIDKILRCTEGFQNVSTETCHSNLFPIYGQNFTITACPEQSNEWLPMMYLCIILTVLMVFSLVAILILNCWSNQMNRFKTSFALNYLTCELFPILWKEKNQDWQNDAKAYLDDKLGMNAEQLQNLLKSAISGGGFLSLVQVLILFIMCRNLSRKFKISYISECFRN